MKCIICKKEILGYGNNPYPVRKEGMCCNGCNFKFVIKARLKEIEKLK